MNRKQFLIIFFKKYLLPMLLLCTLAIVLFNFKKIVEIGSVLGIFSLFIIVLFSLLGLMRFLINRIVGSFPKNIILFLNFLEKFSFIFPISLIFYLAVTWNSRTPFEGIIFIILTLHTLYEGYLNHLKTKSIHDKI